MMEELQSVSLYIFSVEYQASLPNLDKKANGKG
jgi:hypothetical protein